MLVHPQFNPVAFSIGPVSVHWYGLTYLAAFGLFVLLARARSRQVSMAQSGWTTRDVEDLLFFAVVGVVLGGRLGYVLFYKPAHYLGHPLEILQVWQGGMSFHGGLLGVLVALYVFGRSRRRQFLEVGDFVAPSVPTGLMAGRLGNFINGELWGRAADPALPWAMVFPQSGTSIARHPSQLYQALLEGLLLFVLLWFYARRKHPVGRVSGAFLVGYGVFRFIAEFFRQPDSFLGLLALDFTMGQWLCLPMIAFGIWLYVSAPAREARRVPVVRP